jgi:hypothetical protein
MSMSASLHRLCESNPLYSSYVEDPKWQRLFTGIWASCLCLAIVLSLPALVRIWRARRVFANLFGVWEGRTYVPLSTTHRKEVPPAKNPSRNLGFLSLLLWSPLGFDLNIGQSMSSDLKCLFINVIE